MRFVLADSMLVVDLGQFQLITAWGLIFIDFTILSIDYGNIVLTKLIAETWERGSITKKKFHDGARNMDSQTMMSSEIVTQSVCCNEGLLLTFDCLTSR